MVESMFTAAYEEVTAAVVRIRKSARLTQRELAQLLGREQSYIGRIETGQRRLDLVEFVWICKACKADPQEEAGMVIRAVSDRVPVARRRRSRG